MQFPSGSSAYWRKNETMLGFPGRSVQTAYNGKTQVMADPGYWLKTGTSMGNQTLSRIQNMDLASFLKTKDSYFRMYSLDRLDDGVLNGSPLLNIFSSKDASTAAKGTLYLFATDFLDDGAVNASHLDQAFESGTSSRQPFRGWLG